MAKNLVIREAFFKNYPEHYYSFYEFILDAFFLEESSRWIFYKGKTLYAGRIGIFEAVDYLRFDLLPKIEEMERRLPDNRTFKEHWDSVKDEKRHAILFIQESSRARTRFFGRVFSKKGISFYIDKFGVSIFDAVRMAEEFLSNQLSYYNSAEEYVNDEE